MKTIKRELEDALQNIVNNYGVVIKSLYVDWIDVSNAIDTKYIVQTIHTSDAIFIKSVKGNLE